MDTTATNKKNRKPTLVAAALGLIVAIAAGTLGVQSTVQADAAMEDGQFCVAASSDGGDFTSQRGRPGCADTESTPGQPSQPRTSTTVRLSNAYSFSFNVGDLGAVTWADGGDYTFEASDYPNGVPSMFARSGTSLGCAPTVDSCGIRVKVIDAASGKTLSSGQTAIPRAATMAWQINNMPSELVTKTLSGLYRAEDLTSEQVPTYGSPSDIRFEAEFFTAKGGTETVVGTYSPEEGQINCDTNDPLTTESSATRWDVELRSSCRAI